MPFEHDESMDSGKVRVAEMRKVLDNKIALGAAMKQFTEHDGFQVLKALFHNFRMDAVSKRYSTFKEYEAKMDALDLIDGLFGEIDAMVNDGAQAAEELKKVIDSESSTPSLLSLDGEGSDEGQDRS